MSQDQTFRQLLIAGAVLLLPVMVYFRIRSQMTGEELDRTQEGLGILIGVRAFGAATIIALFAFMINPNSMQWASFNLPVWLRWTGVALGAIGGSLLVWTLVNLGKNLTDTVVTRRDHTLVNTGPYRWVRNPFYDAVALCILANGLASANGFILVCGTIVVALLVIRTTIEEEKLIDRFGDSYREYMEQTGRFLPRMR